MSYLRVAERLASARQFLSRLWRLARPYWFAEERQELRILGRTVALREAWIGRGLLLLVIAGDLFLVYLLKLFNDWSLRFGNALQQLDLGGFWAELRLWTGLVTVYLIVAVYRYWLQQLLVIRWRRWLTRSYVARWLADHTYYRMELAGGATDNPEQRIEHDCNTFVQQTLSLGLGLMSNILTLATFAVVLWNLSGTLVVPFLGLGVPGYMLWAALAYALAGSWLSWLIGRRLVRIEFEQERLNADFRLQMSRLREGAESVALHRGEPEERRRLDATFDRIATNWWAEMRVSKHLNWLTTFYSSAASIAPYMIAAPRYFGGQMTFGGLLQIVGAFTQVQSALSWFVSSFTKLAQWKAVVERLAGFEAAMERARPAPGAPSLVASEPRPTIRLDGVTLTLPDGRLLVADAGLELARADRLLIRGPSGAGKTTLLRALAGIWPFGRGRIAVPSDARMLFLSQKPYLPAGTLAEAASYPLAPGERSSEEVRAALVDCGLAHVVPRIGDEAAWSLVLSVGEQQRLAFARALLFRPDWLFLDEATSALDEESERRLYELVRARLPAATLVSVAHRPTVAMHHTRFVTLEPTQRRLVEGAGAA